MIKNLLLAIGTALATNTTPIQKNNESVFNNENEIREIQPKKQISNEYEFIISGGKLIDQYTNTHTSENTTGGFGFQNTININNQSTQDYTDQLTINGIKINGTNLNSVTQTYTPNPNRVLRKNYYYLEFILDGTLSADNNKIKITLPATYKRYSQEIATNTTPSMGLYILGTNTNEMENILFTSNYTLEEKIDILYNQEQYWYDEFDSLWMSTQDFVTETYLNNVSISATIPLNVNTKVGILLMQESNETDGLYNNIELKKPTMSYTITTGNTYTTEIIDLPGLLFTILGMPFSFISQAFNLTLFPGTPYAINVSNMLFAIITGLLVIIILRKLLR